MVQGLHGTGKSTHIEQIAARLNWRCVRINLDSHISRIDLIGKDAIVLEDGKQITTFKEATKLVYKISLPPSASPIGPNSQGQLDLQSKATLYFEL